MQYILALLFLAGFGVYLSVKHLPNLMKAKESKVNKEDIAFRDSINKLTTDFNRTVNININILEEKTKELRRLIELADKKAIQTNSLMTDLEVASFRSRKEIPLPVSKEIVKKVKLPGPAADKYGKIDELIADGLPLEDIAHKIGASRREVQLIMELKRRREQMAH
ncbi:hypothetical protein KJ693_05480 [bacterium]|nr:hypothetical protein [bacterium]MBU1614750.1 hypothetical protein [bacterium]